MAGSRSGLKSRSGSGLKSGLTISVSICLNGPVPFRPCVLSLVFKLDVQQNLFVLLFCLLFVFVCCCFSLSFLLVCC